MLIFWSVVRTHHYPPIFMTIAFIIGNGPSRLQLDLNPLLSLGTVFGCNALYRDFTPHFLVAVDKNMQKEIVDSGYHENNKCIFRVTRDSFNHPNIQEFQISITSPNNSGVAAAYWALKRQHAEVYLIGFDLPALDTQNIYAGTKNYDNHKRKPPKVRRSVTERLIEYTKNSGAKIYRCFDPKLSTKYEGLNDITYPKFRERFSLT